MHSMVAAQCIVSDRDDDFFFETSHVYIPTKI